MDTTSEQRLDRLEQIAKLMVKAGLRARRQSREQDEKINILIDLQIRNDEKFAKNEERFAKNEEMLATLAAKTEESFAIMAASQVSADERLKSFMDTVERLISERGNGKP
jgi:hypothetical protein